MQTEKTYSQELNEAQAALTRAIEVAMNDRELFRAQALRDAVLNELDRHNVEHRES